MNKVRFFYLGIRDCESVCDLTAINGTSPVVVFHERPDNQGTSVTNWSEFLATQILSEYFPGKRASDIKWFEHYEPFPKITPGDIYGCGDTWDEITYNEKNGRCFDPRWRASTKEAVEELIALNKEET